MMKLRRQRIPCVMMHNTTVASILSVSSSAVLAQHMPLVLDEWTWQLADRIDMPLVATRP